MDKVHERHSCRRNKDLKTDFSSLNIFLLSPCRSKASSTVSRMREVHASLSRIGMSLQVGLSEVCALCSVPWYFEVVGLELNNVIQMFTFLSYVFVSFKKYREPQHLFFINEHPNNHSDHEPCQAGRALNNWAPLRLGVTSRSLLWKLKYLWRWIFVPRYVLVDSPYPKSPERQQEFLYPSGREQFFHQIRWLLCW